MMISLETAKKLKEAGLKWEYEYGFPRDCLYYKGKIHGVDGPGALETVCLAPWRNYVKIENLIYAPRLDQMLAEIEKRGYEWELGILTLNDGGTYMIDVALEELIKTESEEWKSFVADSPEEATAQVLIWILGQEDRP